MGTSVTDKRKRKRKRKKAKEEYFTNKEGNILVFFFLRCKLHLLVLTFILCCTFAVSLLFSEAAIRGVLMKMCS